VYLTVLLYQSTRDTECHGVLEKYCEFHSDFRWKGYQQKTRCVKTNEDKQERGMGTGEAHFRPGKNQIQGLESRQAESRMAEAE
jgi:hypothetical protein